MASNVFESIATKNLEVGSDVNQAGRTGRLASFATKVTARVGGWFNGAKAYLNFTAAGSVTGKASAFNAEINLPNQNCTSLGGVYCAEEFNLLFQANTVMADNLNYPSCFASFQLGGTQTQRDIWEDSAGACLFHIGGVNAANGSVFATGNNAASNATLKIIIDGVAYYIMLTTTPSTT